VTFLEELQGLHPLSALVPPSSCGAAPRDEKAASSPSVLKMYRDKDFPVIIAPL